MLKLNIKIIAWIKKLKAKNKNRIRFRYGIRKNNDLKRLINKRTLIIIIKFSLLVLFNIYLNLIFRNDNQRIRLLN